VTPEKSGQANEDAMNTKARNIIYKTKMPLQFYLQRHVLQTS